VVALHLGIEINHFGSMVALVEVLHLKVDDEQLVVKDDNLVVDSVHLEADIADLGGDSDDFSVFSVHLGVELVHFIPI
jgi:hypothetical protein